MPACFHISQIAENDKPIFTLLPCKTNTSADNRRRIMYTTSDLGESRTANGRDQGLPSPSEDLRVRYDSYENTIQTQIDGDFRQLIQRRLDRWRERYSDDVNELDTDIQQLCRENRRAPPIDSPRGSSRPLDDGNVDFSEFYPHEQEHSQFKHGRYTRRFKVVECEPNYSILFGIVSAQDQYDVDPARNTSFYGWSTQATVFSGGERAQNDRGYKDRLVAGNIITLEINCDEKYICLSNKATGTRYELDVDEHRCPLPWRLNIQMSRSDR